MTQINSQTGRVLPDLTSITEQALILTGWILWHYTTWDMKCGFLPKNPMHFNEE